jgi:hypothetical protein
MMSGDGFRFADTQVSAIHAEQFPVLAAIKLEV